MGCQLSLNIYEIIKIQAEMLYFSSQSYADSGFLPFKSMIPDEEEVLDKTILGGNKLITPLLNFPQVVSSRK